MKVLILQTHPEYKNSSIDGVFFVPDSFNEKHFYNLQKEWSYQWREGKLPFEKWLVRNKKLQKADYITNEY